MASNFSDPFWGFESLRIAVIKTVMRYRFEPMVSHLESLKEGVGKIFLTPSNSHLIRIPITVFITSVRFSHPKKILKILRHQRLF